MLSLSFGSTATYKNRVLLWEAAEDTGDTDGRDGTLTLTMTKNGGAVDSEVYAVESEPLTGLMGTRFWLSKLSTGDVYECIPTGPLARCGCPAGEYGKRWAATGCKHRDSLVALAKKLAETKQLAEAK